MSAEEAEPGIDLEVVYNAAQVLAMKGLKLIRVRPGSKVPFDRNWPEIATNDAVKIDEWFGGGGNFNLGLACGMQPNGQNIVAIDIDPKHGGDVTWREWTDKHGRIAGPRHTTPSGGYHLPLIFPEGFRNSRNQLGPGIDTRGEGGQIVLPPSKLIDMETGEITGSYARALGLGLTSLDPIEAPGWLIEALSTPPQPQRVEIERSAARHPSAGNRESPLDFLRRTTDPVDVMIGRYGWQLHSQRGTMTFLTRPGKSTREGQSAVVHDSGAIVIFTTTDVEHLVQRPTSDGTGIKMSLAEFVAAEERISLGELSHRIMEVMPPPALRAGRDAGPEAVLDDTPVEEGVGGSWSTPVDMQGLLDGTLTAVLPTVLARTDGVSLFYPGKLNGVHGESGLGKGWVVLTAAVEQIRAGNKVIYLDMEDTLQSISNRLLVLGLSMAEIVANLVYLRPDDPTDAREIEALLGLVERVQPTLVILDSLGEAFGLDGIDENSDAEVAPWLRRVPRAIADMGPCVIVVDHVTKSMDNPLYQKGSGRKRHAVGGAQYLVETTKPLVKGKGGKLRLTCAKDRNGTHLRGAVSAELVFNPSGPDDMIVRIFPPIEVNESPQEQRDSKVAEQAVRMDTYCRRKRAAFTKTDVVEGCEGAAKDVKRLAWALLVEQGKVVEVEKGKFKSVVD